MNDARPEVDLAHEHGGFIADAGGVRNKHERRKQDKVLDRVVVRLFHALGPVRHRRRVLGIADGVDQPSDQDQVEDVGHPHHELNGEHPGQGGEFWGHGGSPCYSSSRLLEAGSDSPEATSYASLLRWAGRGLPNREHGEPPVQRLSG